MSYSPNLGLPYQAAGALQTDVLFNALLLAVDALMQNGVQDKDLTTPPTTSGGDKGKIWIVASGATGAWAGKANQIAVCTGANLWTFFTPKEGARFWVNDEDTLYAYDGSSWTDAGGGGGGGGGGSAGIEVTDATFGNVSILLHGDGTNGSTTFTDQVAGNTWTASGGAQLTTAEFNFGSASIMFDGAGSDAITMPANSKVDLGTGAWTLQCWYKKRGTHQASSRLFQTRNGDLASGISLVISGDDLVLSMSSDGGSNFFSQTLCALPTTGWREIIVQRNGTQLICVLDGFVVYTGVIAATAGLYYNAADTVVIGGQSSGTSRSINAYIDEFRLTKGEALVPPTYISQVAAFPDS